MAKDTEDDAAETVETQVADPPEVEDSAADEPKDQGTPLSFVGIGASAGGLEAIRVLMHNISPDVNATYVVVQHMAPKHESLLATLIGRETKLKVVDVEDGVCPKSSTVYVTPPNHDIIYDDGKLRLVRPSEEVAAPKPSVDRFFISLAENLGDRAVGVVLSGTGSDGSYGVQAIRGAGGITIAQDDQSAKYDGMPVTAIETGCIDLILSPTEIGTHLSKILSLPRNFEALQKDDHHEHPMMDVLQILLARTRVDFREYKPTTIQRRIERRMNALAITSQAEYTAFCRTSPTEVDALFKDLLISVTRFFRDPKEFEGLAKVLNEKAKNSERTGFRVWLAGCATGEEVYSVAILLAEALGGVDALKRENVQIFASDIDTEALRVARAGHYSLSALNDIPKEYADKYFQRHQGGLQVINELREVVLFSSHNLCQDPPFLNVDLVCCRNLLIYFGAALQQKVLARIHFSLKPDGLLFLGSAETISGSEDLFKVIADNRQVYRKLRRKRGAERRGGPAHFEMPRVPVTKKIPPSRLAVDEADARSYLEGLIRSIGPDGILIGERLNIIRIFGNVSSFISLAETTQLSFSLTMLKEPLVQEARTLVTLSLKHGERRRGRAHVLDGDRGYRVWMEVYPLVLPNAEEPVALLILNREPIEDKAVVGTPKSRDLTKVEANKYIGKLEQEVDSTREALQQVIEQLESANEELQAMNEEFQSTNEELQATNEELETSNEELQSTNEELVTVNEELQVNSSELASMTGELTSVLQNIGTPILVVDTALQISHASRTAVEMFDLPTPLARPHLSQCMVPHGFPSLPDICNEALRLGKTLREEITTRTMVYLLTCAPYVDSQGRVIGATLNIIQVKAAQRLADEMGHILDHMPLNFMRRSADGEILRISAYSAAMLNSTPSKLVGRKLTEVMEPTTAAMTIARDGAFLSGQLESEFDVFSLPVEGHKEGRRWIKVARTRYEEFEGVPSVFSVGFAVTDQQEDAMHIRRLEDQMDQMATHSGIATWSVRMRDMTPRWSPRMFQIFGVDPETYEPSAAHLEFYHPEDRKVLEILRRASIEKLEPFDFEARITRQDNGEERRVFLQVRVHEDMNGQATHLIGLLEDLGPAE